jgi:hypothetical protein
VENAQINYLLSVLFFTLVSLNIYSQQPNTVNEFDPGIVVGLELSPRVRLDFASGREKVDEFNSSKWKVSGGVSFRMKPLWRPFTDDSDSDKSHLLVLGIAYEYGRASEDGVKFNEHKIMLDGTGRLITNKILMSDRNRFEFRWIDGKYNFRYRNRFMLERTFKVKKIRLTPYASAEAFWDVKYTKWNQFKFTGGAVFPINRRTSLDVYYERIHCVTCTDQHYNILGVAFNLFFKK